MYLNTMVKGTENQNIEHTEHPVQQNVLLKISQSIIGTLDYQKVMQIISDGMSELLEIETAAIYLVEKENKLYLGATTPPLDPNLPDNLRKISIADHPHIEKTIQLKKPLFLPDTRTAKLSKAEKFVVEIRKLRSLLYFPFVEEMKVLGVLILGTSNKSRHFTKEEIDLGQTVANQLSIGIQNARLHHDLQIKNQRLETEIKERINAEKALRTSEEHLSNALRIGKMGHWEYNFEEDLFTFTDEFYEILRTTAEEMNGYVMTSEKYAKQFVHPDDQHLIAKEIKKNRNIADKGFSIEIEHRIIYADGEEGCINVRYKILKSDKGKAIKIIGVNQDITERKKNEQSLLEAKKLLEKSEYLYRNLFSQAPEGIFLMTIKGKIVQANNAFAEMHGYTIEEVLNKNISEIDVLKDKVFSSRTEKLKRLSKGEIVQSEVEHFHKKGNVIQILVTTQQINLDGEPYLLSFHQDLTHQKQVEKELKEHKNNLELKVKEKTRELDNVIEELKSTNEELSQKNQIINLQIQELKQALNDLKEAQTRMVQAEKMASLGILTAGVAHEINNPLNYIMGSYMALKSNYEEEGWGNRELINSLFDKLKTGLDKVTEIVKGLNQFSRDNRAKNETCKLHPILDNCLTMLGNQTKNRIRIRKKYEKKPLNTIGNVGQLHQAFLNILTNAVQAISEEGEIQISTIKKNNTINIIIADNGEGIPKQYLTKITDPFFTTKDPGKGTGLGLSITYSIIKEHKGILEFESEEGNGTKVKITLPALKN